MNEEELRAIRTLQGSRTGGFNFIGDPTTPRRRSFDWKTREIQKHTKLNVIISALCFAVGIFLLFAIYSVPYVSLWRVNPALGGVVGTVVAILIVMPMILFLQPEVRSYISSKTISKKDLDLLPPHVATRYFWNPENGSDSDGATLIFEGTDDIRAMRVYEVTSVPVQIMGRFEDVLRACFGLKICFKYSFALLPADEDEVENLVQDRRKVPEEQMDRFHRLVKGQQAGIFKAKVFFEVFENRSIHRGLYADARREVYDAVNKKGLELLTSIRTHFHHVELAALDRERVYDYIDRCLSGGGDARFFVTGLEAASHFLRLPSMAARALSRTIPARFTVPTNHDFDQEPIGVTIETTHPDGNDYPVGLLDEQLSGHVLISGDDLRERQEMTLTILDRVLRTGRPCVFITRRKFLRRLVSIHPNILYARVGEDVGFKFFDTEGIKHGYYTSQLVNVFLATHDLTPDKAPLLRNEMNELYSESKDRIPEINEFCNNLQTKLTTPGMNYNQMREYQEIMEVLKGWMVEYLTLCFQETTVPMHELLGHAPLVLEIEQDQHLDHEILAVFLMLKVLLAARASRVKDLVVYNDVNHIFSGTSRDPVTIADHLFDLFRHVDGCLIQDIPHGRDVFPLHILSDFNTFLVSRVVDHNDLEAILRPIGIAPRYKSETNKVSYVKNLKEGEALFKRPDTNQGFPVKVFRVETRESIDDELIEELFGNTFKGASPITPIVKNTTLENVYYMNFVKPEAPETFYPYIILKDIQDALQTRKPGIHTRTDLAYRIIDELLKDAKNLVEKVTSGGSTYFTLTDLGKEAVKEFMEFYKIRE